jgi:hypothetical protein
LEHQITASNAGWNQAVPVVNDAVHVNDEPGFAADLVNRIHFRPQTLTVFRCAKQNHFRLGGGASPVKLGNTLRNKLTPGNRSAKINVQFWRRVKII